jgi:succinate-acetate transporter protein
MTSTLTEHSHVEVSTAQSTADPTPLGLSGFGLTLFVAACFYAGLVPSSVMGVVLPVALFYGGLGLVLAGMWEFKRNNTFGAFAFTSYGTFFLSFAAYVHFIVPTLPKAQASDATGIYLLAWTIFTAIVLVASFGKTPYLRLLFVLLFLTFVFLTISTYSGSATLGKVGGYIGIVTALLAWYGSLATCCHATWGKKVLPV